ncbi:MAG: hypothetical protein CMA10_03300 [Euryarchaeota archaeon]|nr:hypothetical protein [Euryarchaeota archaeon]
MRSACLLSLMMVSLCLAGCLEGPSVNSGIGDTTEQELALPDWEIGDQWLYTFVTPQFGEDSARLVVADKDNESGIYRLGISSKEEAQRHAVINHNPFLGRITMDGLSVYEQGEERSVFNFPWNIGDMWEFTLLGQDWTAETKSIYNGVVDVSATSDDGHSLTYSFSGRDGFINSLVWMDDEGTEQLRMELTQTKTDYQGDVFFYRARDLLDSVYEDNENDISDSFLDSGHPDGTNWDVLVWYIDLDIAGGGSGTLSLKDHQGASPLTRAWGSGASEKGSIGTIPSLSGDYSLTVTLRGGDSLLHFKVAGGIYSEWTL